MRAVRDTWLIFRRHLAISARNPTWVLVGLSQPVLYFALFGPLLRGVVTLPGFAAGVSWQQVFVPALLVQLGLFGTSFVGFGIIAEVRNGVVERLRVTPASRVGLLLGRVLLDGRHPAGAVGRAGPGRAGLRAAGTGAGPAGRPRVRHAAGDRHRLPVVRGRAAAQDRGRAGPDDQYDPAAAAAAVRDPAADDAGTALAGPGCPGPTRSGMWWTGCGTPSPAGSGAGRCGPAWPSRRPRPRSRSWSARAPSSARLPSPGPGAGRGPDRSVRPGPQDQAEALPAAPGPTPRPRRRRRPRPPAPPARPSPAAAPAAGRRPRR